MGSQIPASGQIKAPNKNTVNVDPNPSFDALQGWMPTATLSELEESFDQQIQQSWLEREPTPERSPPPNQTPKGTSTASQRRTVPARKRGIRRHNLLLDKLGRKKTKRQRREWKILSLLQKVSKECRITKLALETNQEQMQALRQGEAYAQAQAAKFEKALECERHLQAEIKSELSAVKQEASAFCQAAACAHAQAGEFEKALEYERRLHTETKSELSAAKHEASAFYETAAGAHAQAGEFEKKLACERHWHTKTKSELSASQQEVSTLLQGQSQAGHDRNMMRRKMKDQQAMLDDAVKELNKSKETAATARQGQLKAISELNKAMRLNQGSDQSTDTQLVQKMVELRNNIRTWSLTYFITEFENTPRLCRQDMEILYELGLDSVMRKDCFERSLQDTTIRPTVARSVLWAVLQRDLFRQYLWVIRPFGRWVRDTHKFLSSKMMMKYSQDFDEKSHKFNIWRANGNGMFSQAPRPGQKRMCRNRTITQLVTSTMRLLKPLLASQDQKDAEGELYQIIDQALALDEELCQQVADLSVRYLEDSSGLVGARFNPRAMTTEIGSKDATAEDVVSVVLAPALIKRGNSAGNDFNKQVILVPMEVICEPAEPNPTSRANPIPIPTPTPSPRV
ncbi:unnamed protein product [Clonostachys solani]|uniref:Uncharacterized protein n=1 Tax=Clonostachys solani TaxID=160281 RepID=A0A9N9ZJM4_9HYPO|nr:unnamed protein product [Clonostachys solani]